MLNGLKYDSIIHSNTDITMNRGYYTKDYIENMPDNIPTLYGAYRNLHSIPDLLRFRCLTVIDFSINNLTSLPDYLPPTLKKLFCHSNQLQKVKNY